MSKLIKAEMSICALLKSSFGIESLLVTPKVSDVSKYNSYLENLYKDCNITSKGSKELFVELFSFKIRDGFHFHWLGGGDFKSILNAVVIILIAIKYRVFQRRVFWTVHNKYPHNNNYPILNRLFYKIASRITTNFHVHGKSAIQIISKLLQVPSEKIFVYEHPRYEITNDNRLIPLESLFPNYDPNKFTICIVGAISEYKLIIEVLDCLYELTRTSNVQIIVAGKINGKASFKQMVLNFPQRNKHILLLDRYLTSEEVDSIHIYSDLAVYGYKDVLTSGSVIRSLDCKTLTLASNQGCIRDIVDKNLILFNSLKELAVRVEEQVFD
jgi:hypothetical protein